MKIRTIRTKMLLGTVPFILLSMIILTLLSGYSSEQIIYEQIKNNMEAELEANINDINTYLEVIKSTAMNLSRTVGGTYKQMEMDDYGTIFENIIWDNELILGSGIWFEPNVYDITEKYMGPYWYKDGSNTLLTYDYSNAEYDYFIQEYYTLAKESEGKAIITDPYYDPTLDVVMATCTAPIYDAVTNKFIGCVTVDITLDTIDIMMDTIKAGEAGNVILITGNGTYMYSDDEQKVTEGLNITEETNASMARAAANILAQSRGMESYTEQGEDYNLYFDTVDGVEWCLIICIPQAELDAPVQSLLFKMISICAAALAICIIAVVVQVQGMSKSVKKVKIFAGNLAGGDLTIDKLDEYRQDEMGEMSRSLNEMFTSNQRVIGNISNYSEKINVSSSNLSDATKKLVQQFENIEDYIAEVNEAMMSASGATEEVNASIEEINSSMHILASETALNSETAVEIRKRAGEMAKHSKEAYEYAVEVYSHCEENLEAAYNNTKVVENIGVMANLISNIAEQINLLSLNASIEAARAGEQGRGFAVVATEIGKLAGETSKAVEEIQMTISDVQTVFGIMVQGTKELLTFLKETVTPDYNSFVQVGKQYGEDAESVGERAENIRNMTENIEKAFEEVTQAIENVARAAQDTASNSINIRKSIEDMSTVVDGVHDMTNEQDAIAGQLKEIVSNFKV